mgnify:FL=1
MSDKIKISAQEIEELSQFYKIFGDPTRLRILHTLFGTEMCVGELAEKLSMEQSAISHQLRVLKQIKLVAARRDGKQMVYSLADDHIAQILMMGLEHIREED